MWWGHKGGWVEGDRRGIDCQHATLYAQGIATTSCHPTITGATEQATEGCRTVHVHHASRFDIRDKVRRVGVTRMRHAILHVLFYAHTHAHTHTHRPTHSVTHTHCHAHAHTHGYRRTHPTLTSPPWHVCRPDTTIILLIKFEVAKAAKS